METQEDRPVGDSLRQPGVNASERSQFRLREMYRGDLAWEIVVGYEETTRYAAWLRTFLRSCSSSERASSTAASLRNG